jgi:putative toxin-antitoxin system antitoxin component (TIGR02293 family)
MAGSVAELLGGRRVLGRSRTDPASLQARLREGLPFAAFEALLRTLGLTPGELAALLGVAPRTLARRKAGRRLTPIESDRLYRVAHVALLAGKVLGSPPKATDWLRRPNRALGGLAPMDDLDTEIGVRRVEEVLLRIEHGVHS